MTTNSINKRITLRPLGKKLTRERLIHQYRIAVKKINKQFLIQKK